MTTKSTPSEQTGIKPIDLYQIKYRGEILEGYFSFSEACKKMREIPASDELEVLLPNGEVHFTLPPNRRIRK